VTEAALEKKLIDNLQRFLLELGKGFHLLPGSSE
jgi:predicted nuclease of restriction endonuclease-like (RecB) superfamily